MLLDNNNSTKRTYYQNKFAIYIAGPENYIGRQACKEVTEGLYNSLIKDGYDVIFSNSAFVVDRTPIIFYPHLLRHPFEIPSHAILFNLEQIDSGSRLITEAYISLLCDHEVWDYAPENIKALRSKGVKTLYHVDLGGLAQPHIAEHAAQQDIDVLFYGSMNSRRQDIMEALQAVGCNAVTVSDVYGHERDALISRARIVLNVHYYETKIFEIARVSYLLTNGKCVVSENGVDETEQEYADVLLFAPYDDIVNQCLELLKNPEKIQEMGMCAKIFMQKRQNEYTLKTFIETRKPQIYPKREIPRILNIGSGKDWQPNYLNADILESWNPDIIFNLECPLPENGLILKSARFGDVHLGDNTFDMIICFDVLEHLSELSVAMTTCLRLLKPEGLFRIQVPYDLSYGAWQDPTHVRAFNERSWLYYTNWFWYMGWGDARFDVRSLSFIFSPLGASLQSANVDQELIIRTPRAVDAMMVDLVKRHLTDDEKVEFRKKRRSE